MRKFFVDTNQINDEKIVIVGDDVNHIKNVLRLDVGTLIRISDGQKNYISKIEKIEKEEVICKIENEVKNENESEITLDIFQGLVKADKMEYIIQKCTELGVNSFYPVSFRRSVVKLDKKDEEKKLARWKKILEGASKQSGRDIIPKINSIINVNNICNIIKEYDIVLVAYELEKQNSIKSQIEKIKNKSNVKIACVIGPEGGIEQEEIDLLKQNGAEIITLGNRILRTETAPIVITSVIMYEFGELGGN